MSMQQINLDIYGAEPIPWSRALEQLEAGAATSYWLATTRPDGRPHVAGVGAKWVDGRLYFTSGAGTRKSRNLSANPHCVVSMSFKDLDLVVEGTARKVSDGETVRRLAERFAEEGWPAEARDGRITAPYSAPSAGPPPWDLYEIVLDTTFGVATAEPNGATRWRFLD
jgi:pyridoxine/pyridoxamine 5'-phosphate oxidase